MMKKIVILLIAGIISLTAFGRDFICDGVSYTVIDEKDKTCETKSGMFINQPGNNVSGHITIPQEVYDGKFYYTVSRVGKYSFSTNKKLKTIKLPKSVVSIGSSAFYDSGIKNITLPESIRCIEEDAFQWCQNLDAIKLPEGLDSISAGTFTKCKSLKSIYIPSSIQSIGSWAFMDCLNLTSISLPDSLIKIGKWAFFGCNKLLNITIPKCVTSIERGALTSCVKLEGIEVSSANTNYRSQNGVLFNYDLTTIIQYPAGKKGDYQIPQTVIELGSDAFVDCKNLKSVIIPTSVSKMGDECFMGAGIKTIDVPSSIEEIPSLAFYHCKNLRLVDLPENIDAIGHRAFGGCTKLDSIRIPNSCEIIGNLAFENCKNIKHISLANPLLVSVGEKAFIDCSKLSDITIDAPIIVLKYDAFYQCNKIKKIKLLCKEAAFETNTAIFTDKVLNNAQLYVTPNIMEEVKTNYPWNSFKNVVVTH